MRARRWTSRVASLHPVLLLSFAVIFAVIIVLKVEVKQKHQAAAAEREEKERAIQIELLREDQLQIQTHLRNWTKESADQPLPARPRRGVVICAGGNKLLINVYVSLQVLRSFGSHLPVEIYHNGPQDIGPITRAALKAFPDVRLVDLSTLNLPSHHRRPQLYNGYVQKILSLYLTSFEQVLLLDADSQPLKDPQDIFESETFRKHGNIFWPDFWKEGNSESPHAEVYQWLGLTPPWETNKGWQCAESGQVFFDKTRLGDVLEWLWFLNSHAELLYKHMLGDKDTFEIAFMLARRHNDFFRVPISPGVPLTQMQANVRRGGWRERFMNKEESNRYLRVGMLQYDVSGLPAFIHRTERTKFANWRNGYSLEMMHPKFVLPSFGPDIPPEAKAAAWNLHSLPESMVEENCTCCVLTPGSRAVITGAAGYRPASQEGFVIRSNFLNMSAAGGQVQSTCKAGVWSRSGVSLNRFPLIPLEYFGELLQKPLDAGFEAYNDIVGILGPKLKWTLSP